MNFRHCGAAAVVCLIAGQLAMAQLRVDPSNMHERMIAVVPMIGSGTYADPKRPLYAPTPEQLRSSGLLSFSWQLSDDGKHGIIEFVARDRNAFKAILADHRTIKAFEKGKHKSGDIERELKKYKSAFSMDTFGGRR